MPPAEPGIYVLVLRCPALARSASADPAPQRLGPGYYFSAYGPGGLRPRIDHHRHRAERAHWHIDYLRRYTRLESVWHACGARREHEWAAKIAAMPEAALALRGFGISDCRCATQLVGGCADRDGVTTMLGGESAAVTGQNENS